MKKLLIRFPQLLLATTLFATVSCNSGSTTTESSDSIGKDTSAGTVRNIPAVGDSAYAITSDSTNDANVAMTDNDFISKNITDNTMELELSRVGRDKGTDAQVKKAAQQMITDHTQMLVELKTLASKKQVTVPAANTKMSGMLGLPDAKGKEFDQAWASQMLTMHEAKIRELQNVLNQTQDADIKALATKALPKIKMHSDLLIKITSTTGSSQPQ